MLEERNFHIVWVAEGRGAGINQLPNPDVTVRYFGNAVEIQAP